MASRHLSRSIVLQSLYEWDFYDKKPALKDIVERNIKDFGPGLEELDFIWQFQDINIQGQKWVRAECIKT